MSVAAMPCAKCETNLSREYTLFFLSVLVSIPLVLRLACSLGIYSASICCAHFFRRSLNFLSFIVRWLFSVSHFV